MFQLLVRRPWFRLLWTAGAISLLGDWLGFVAISRLTLDQGGGPIALALVYAAHVLPHTWAMPIAGVLADRFDRRRILVSVPILQGLFTIAMAFFAARGALGPLQLLVVVRATIATCIPPAETAALRHTVESTELVPANALVGGTWSVCYVIGMALGGVIAVFGPATALLLDASSFFLAALFASRLPVMRPPADVNQTKLRGISFVSTIPRDLKYAFDHARANKDLFRAVLGKAPVAIGGGAGWILVNWLADQAKPLGTAALSLGILQATRGAGTGIGPMLVSWYHRGQTPPRNVERWAVALTFVSIVVFSWLVSNPTLLVIAALTWGLGTGTNWVLCAANLQRLAPDSMIGRLSSLDELWTTGSLVFGAMGAGVLLQYGSSMVQTAAIAISVGLLFFVWLDQREALTPLPN
ncbi:MAG TPA: MFS transporter [Polyangium sp.]|nr:MFS transporter [Polyangium sp.]